MEFILYWVKSDSTEMEGMEIFKVFKFVEKSYFTGNVFNCCAEMQYFYFLQIGIGTYK